MAFSEEIKLEVKRKSDFRCVVCGTPIVEIHHIVSQEEQGPDTIENAVALCAHCHNIYGGNPLKREELIKLRDMTYKRIEEKFNAKENFLKVEKAEGKFKVPRNDKDIVLRCNISEKENFEQAAKKIYNLIYTIGKKAPKVPRTLIVEIQGHRNSEGGYDHDMFELQYEFLTKCILPFIHILHIPLISIENPNIQEDLKSQEIMIFESKEEAKQVEEKLKDDNWEFLNLQGEQ